MITVRRTHEIACGHRVYGHESKCAHLHGHNYRFEFTVTAQALDHLGRVLDFGVVKTTLCAWLEHAWDHKMLLFHADPLVTVLIAHGEPVVQCLFNPTAENMAQEFGTNIAPFLLPDGMTCVEVVVWETGKCAAVWSRPT